MKVNRQSTVVLNIFIQLFSCLYLVALNLYTMTGIDMRNFLESMVNQLQAEDFDSLKYVLKENFTGSYIVKSFILILQLVGDV